MIEHNLMYTFSLSLLEKHGPENNASLLCGFPYPLNFLLGSINKLKELTLYAFILTQTDINFQHKAYHECISIHIT